MDPDLDGRTILITGGTSGLGRVAARALARRGAEVLIVGSTAEKGEAAEADLREATDGDVTFLQADLAEVEAVRGLAKRVRDRVNALDVLANNAGLIADGYATTSDGVEMTAAVNVRAPYLLAVELAPLLAEAGEARIVNTASEASREGSADVGALADPGVDGFSWWEAYASSKLADLALTLEEADRLDGSGVVAHAYHPGFVPGTRLFRQLPRYARWGTRLASVLPWPRTRTVETAGADLARLCVEERYAGSTGLYVNGTTVETPDERARDPTYRADLWSWLTASTGTEADDLAEAAGTGLPPEG